jgi:hypothetical protein
MAKKSPVGTKLLSIGANVMGEVKNALRSIPDDPVVA